MEQRKYKKLRIDDPIYWSTHRGGWGYVVNVLQSELHVQDGTLFLSAVEDVMMKKKPITEPWVGFVHQVPKNNLEKFLDLERLLENETWKSSLPYCKGIFTLSEYLKTYLQSKRLPVPIDHVPYAIDFQFKEFDFIKFLSVPKKVLFIGEFMRDFNSFSDLEAQGYQKVLLVTDSFNKLKINLSPTVTLLDRLADAEYDDMLSQSVVFLSLIDAPANTTVVECLGRNTPILINRLPGVVDYLGDDYPFYYSSLEEASRKLLDIDLILRTSKYMATSANKIKLRKEYFLLTLQSGYIYNNLPIPNSQKISDENKFDLTIVITSYKRVYNIAELLERFSQQQFEGCFEIILWNNNAAKANELESICRVYSEKLKIRLIHSSENYYCAMRLSVTYLMRSDYMLICDDDVLPGHHYIQTFWDKFRVYGPDVVLCARGHLFELHEFDEQNMAKVWKSGLHMKFFDELVSDRELHFFHADNCFLSKSVLQRVNGYEWENLDFILVDDYWMSFIISHRLGIPIMKIKLDSQMHFTPCADDKEIALFHNPNVRRERTNFYHYHMRQGWPNSAIQRSSLISQGVEVGKGVGAEFKGQQVSVNQINDTLTSGIQLTSNFFKRYDVSVVVCMNDNLENLCRLIERFKFQDFAGTFELIIWNNSLTTFGDLMELQGKYRDQIDIKIIDSSRNYFDIPQLALTSLLMGERVLFCSESVLPKSNYLNYLVGSLIDFGQSVVVSVTDKGSSFEIREKKSNPNLNESMEVSPIVDRQVGNINGDTYVLSKASLKKVSTYKMPSDESLLTYHHWLSHILSSELDLRIMKIHRDLIMDLVQYLGNEN